MIKKVTICMLAVTFCINAEAMSTVTTIKSGNGQKAMAVKHYNQHTEKMAVEFDVWVTNPTYSKGKAPKEHDAHAANNESPNDPRLSFQHAWKAHSSNKGSSSILNGYKLKPKKNRTRIGIVDGGFFENTDIKYAEGHNFIPSEAGEGFIEDYYTPGCSDGHGTAVAGIAAATPGNSFGIAGIVDADIVAAKTLSCEGGLLSDAANAIYWLAGAQVAEIPLISEPVDVINLSLSAEASTCPEFLQEAINFAYERDIAIVAPVGNGDSSTSNQTPSNCNHVISVAANDLRGLKAEFSNHGEPTTVSALGEQIISYGNNENEYYYWSGTSFAAPLVSGMILLAKEAFPNVKTTVIADEIINSTTAFATNPPHEGKSCANGRCGAGVLNAEKLISNIEAIAALNLFEIEHTLSSRLNLTEYIFQHYPAGVNPCNSYELATTGNIDIMEGEWLEIFKAGDIGVNEELLVKRSQDDRFVITGVSEQNRVFDVRTCSDEQCDNELTRFTIEPIAIQGCI